MMPSAPQSMAFFIDKGELQVQITALKSCLWTKSIISRLTNEWCSWTASPFCARPRGPFELGIREEREQPPAKAGAESSRFPLCFVFIGISILIGVGIWFIYCTNKGLVRDRNCLASAC